jgi:hypothetical protein
MLVEASSPLATEDRQPIRPPAGTVGLVEDARGTTGTRDHCPSGVGWLDGCSTRGQCPSSDP